MDKFHYCDLECDFFFAQKLVADLVYDFSAQNLLADYRSQ